MSKWERRLQEIVKNEREKHVVVWDLCKELREVLHGFTPVDKNLLFKKIEETCNKTTLIDSEVSDILMEQLYKNDDNEGLQKITVNIKGDFNGNITIETNNGWRNDREGKVNIFYVSSYDGCKVFSDKEEQFKEMYKEYKHHAIEELIDIALSNKHYLKYDDVFQNYEIWHKSPSWNEDRISGSLDSWKFNDNRKMYKEVFDNLNKLKEYNNVRECAESELNGISESYAYEWTEYRL